MLLEAKELKKTFHHPKKVQLIKGVNLTVAPGETVAIIGRSGQGKSTLLQMLGTLEKPCSGDLIICGQKVSFFNKNVLRSKCIGFVFQSFHLLDDHTALENILMPARIARKNTHKGSPAYLYGYELLRKSAWGTGLILAPNSFPAARSSGLLLRVPCATIPKSFLRMSHRATSMSRPPRGFINFSSNLPRATKKR